MRFAAAALIFAMLFSAAARAEMPHPYIYGFKSLDISAPCLQISTSATPGPGGEILEGGRYFRGAQTLWVESACTQTLTFRQLTLRYKEGAADAARNVVFSYRKQDGQRIEGAKLALSITDDGAACQAAELIGYKAQETPVPVRCKSLSFGPREGIGFVFHMPLEIDWRGDDGLFLQAETDQTIPIDSSIESRDSAKNPFGDKH